MLKIFISFYKILLKTVGHGQIFVTIGLGFFRGGGEVHAVERLELSLAHAFDLLYVNK